MISHCASRLLQLHGPLLINPKDSPQGELSLAVSHQRENLGTGVRTNGRRQISPRARWRSSWRGSRRERGNMQLQTLQDRGMQKGIVQTGTERDISVKSVQSWLGCARALLSRWVLDHMPSHLHAWHWQNYCRPSYHCIVCSLCPSQPLHAKLSIPLQWVMQHCV